MKITTDKRIYIAAVIANIPLFCIGLILLVAGWWAVDKINPLLGGGLAAMFLGTIILNAAFASINRRAFSERLSKKRLVEKNGAAIQGADKGR